MAAIKEYKCPCCGGAVEFDSKIQKIKCPYCDTEFDTEAFTAHEEEVQNAKPDEKHAAQLRVQLLRRRDCL